MRTVRVAVLVALLSPRVALADEWSNLLLDVSAGVPKVENDSLNIDLNGAVGYSIPTLGGVVQGRRSTFAVLLPGRELIDVRTGAGGRGFVRLGDGDTSLATLGLDLSFSQYFNSTSFVDASFSSMDETSQMFRGWATVGGFFRSSSVDFLFDGGLGLQSEVYQSETISVVAGTASVSQRNTNTFSMSYRGRFLGQWDIVPDSFRAKLLTTFEGFSLSRSTATFSYLSGRSIQAQDSLATASRLEAMTKLLVDFNIWDVVDIRPGVYGQLEYVRVSNNGTAIAMTVPSGGLVLNGQYPF